MEYIFTNFSQDSLHALCDKVAALDNELAAIIQTYGYPPFWSRANTFATLVQIILEQQVSLASARAALEKLRLRAGTITPKHILKISDNEFKGLYITGQKKIYIQELAQEIQSGRLDLKSLEKLPDDAVEQRLTSLKGIGTWTTDIYMIMVLHRPDRFPLGDVAAVSAVKQLKNLPKQTIAADLEKVVAAWRPYRTVAAMLLWHYYLAQRGRS